MTSVSNSLAQPVAPARSPWFRSAPFDLLLILCVPFLTWPLVMMAQSAWGPDLLTQLILLTATGHYFATFVRAYGDLELYQRFRLRFLLTPPLLLVACIGLFVSGHGAALLLVTAAWAFWHWLAQAFGFARIYDIKVGSFRPLTAWLDKALVIMGFVGAATLTSGSVATFGKLFLSAGIPLPSAADFAIVQWVVLVTMIAVVVAYVANLGWAIVRGQPWSWQKQFMHVTTIGYYWFAFAWLPNVLVAYVLYELFHDVQYYAITWITCQHRVRRPGVTSWLGRLFRPGFGAAVVFVALMTAFGGIDALGRGNITPESTAHQVWLGVFLTLALLHYYYDGFIWKARESALGADLGIAAGLRAKVVPGLRHAGLWGLFVVPLVGVIALGGPGFTERERAEALVAVAPADFVSQADLGLELARARELPAAIEHYRLSIEANPDFAQARANYGAALDLHGDLDGAIEQYRAALQCVDQGGAHAQAHINLGVLLLLRGDRDGADRHFTAGQRLGGENPINRMMGMAAAVPANATKRRQGLYERVLQRDPSLLDAHFNLANLLLAQGRHDLAIRHYELLVSRAPQVLSGRIGLATCQAALGQIPAARATVAQILQQDPANADALALRARIGQ